jgi:hypothetical protein
MARSAGVSQSAVSRIWRAFGLKPHIVQTWKLSADPQFIDKVRDVVGLYMAPPENALVLCVDEKSQIQALDRTAPCLPMLPTTPARMTHDYVRNGTTSLFAAFDLASGSVIAQHYRRHRHGSTSGTRLPGPSSGPRAPTRSWKPSLPTVNELTTQDTRCMPAAASSCCANVSSLHPDNTSHGIRAGARKDPYPALVCSHLSRLLSERYTRGERVGVRGEMEPRRIRLIETSDGLARLRQEIAGWVDRRRRLDPLRQFHTQLSSLETTSRGALARVEIAFDTAAGTTEEIYRTCRDFERRATLIRRLWTWFADKFDQRERPGWEKVLAAADEVAWSIHVEANRRAAARGDSPVTAPGPLPFLDAIDVPEAVPRDEPPTGLRADSSDDLLRLLLARLPVPVVALPVSTRWSPWMLVALGHEAGHHLEHDLLPHGQLMRNVSHAVNHVTEKAELSDDDVARWQTWSHELFADLIGLVAMGPAAVALMLPYELGDTAHMIDRGRGGGRYPAPAVRLQLQEALARRLRLDLNSVLAPLRLDQHLMPGISATAGAVCRDLDLVPDVAAALLQRLGPFGTVPELIGLNSDDFADGSVIDLRADALLRSEGPDGDQGPRVVRQLASATYAAWTRLPVPAEPATVERLAITAFDAITAAREDGTRAYTRTTTVQEDASEELAALLLGTP